MDSNLTPRATLSELIQICRDGQEGFLTAAENVDADDIKLILNEYSLQRAKFVGELQSASHALGDSNPENSSSISGTMHRGWINLKIAVIGRDRYTILTECEKGEESAVGAYKKLLLREIPTDVRHIVERQYSAIQAAHNLVKALRDAES